MPQQKIVLIDDDMFVRVTTAKLLEKKDFTVYTAHNGQDGLRLVHELMPDTVLVDLMMPDLNGWEIIKNLHADKKTEGVDIIIFTASDDPVPPDIKKMNLDYRVLKKPFYLQQLIDMLQKRMTENE